MNTTDLKPLPARPNLEQYKKQAKDLKSSATNLKLADAQLQIAREHGFLSWPKFAKHIEGLSSSNSPVSKFEQAADAIVTGDRATLESLLNDDPKLIHQRSTRVHRATLLHYISANGFENYRQKTPANAAEIAKLLLNAGAEVDAIADSYGKDTTLGLIASSIHPKRAGVQIALLELLLEHGADVNGVAGGSTPLIAALHNGHGEAAAFLASHGARLDLEGAAGVGGLDLVKTLLNTAPKDEMESGFKWACEYGRNDVVEFLLNAGVTGETGLHWAIIGRQLDTIKLLLKHGASLEALNEYGATPLGQALWSAEHNPEIDYVPIIEILRRHGRYT